MTSIKWPDTGNNSHYFILDIPYLSIGILRNALAFISGHCYYKETRHRDKYLKFPGVSPTPVSSLGDTMMLDNLFLEPHPEGANDSNNKDMYRFQTTPDSQEKLLSDSAINAILSKVSCVIARLTKVEYDVQKVSVLFSRPHGPEQGLHYDDYRETATINESKELLSVIVALMPGTMIDIGTVNNGRKTFPIPTGAMILMSGKCLHGGSAYSKSNARLHFEFSPRHQGNMKQSSVQNFVAARYRCPLDTCPLNKDGRSFDTQKQLYNHWQTDHLKKGTIKFSLKKFIHMKNGGSLVTCNSCGKGYKSKALLRRHMRRCA